MDEWMNEWLSALPPTFIPGIKCNFQVRFKKKKKEKEWEIIIITTAENNVQGHTEEIPVRWRLIENVCEQKKNGKGE